MKIKNREEIKLIKVMFKILDGLLSPNLVCNKSGVILFANKVYRGLVEEKPENKVFWEVYPTYKTMPGFFKSAIDHETETRSEISVTGRAYIVRVIPINNILADDILFAIYFEDFTLQMNLNEQLKTDKKSLQRSFLDTILQGNRILI